MESFKELDNRRLYAVFFGVFLYMIGFVGNFIVPTTMDGEATTPFVDALIINAALIGLFGVQHSVMARPGFKRLWTRVIPKEAERSTYVLLSSIALGLLFCIDKQAFLLARELAVS